MKNLRPGFLILLISLLTCKGDPFGNPKKSIDEFSMYQTDFVSQNDGGMKTALLSVIAGAKSSLVCAFSALTYSDVIAGLVDKARSGVPVKIAFDEDVRSTDAGSLALQA